MNWNAEAYFKASQEHLNEAWSLFYSDTGNHNLYAHYWAGIAIECMLRAYQLQDSKEW
ncbi:hypothetical protein LBMAG21_14970 [Armatimonadota bacterium]|nr:hypothetical protein LBMAG21_14970 [Armatimonadota bacterium]